MATRSREVRRRLGYAYANENPLGEGAMVGLAVGGVALLAGLGYLLYRSNNPAAPTTPATATTTNPASTTNALTVGNVFFVASDFQYPANPDTMMPNNYVGQVSSGSGSASLIRSTGTTLVGTYSYDTTAMSPGTVSFTVQTGDGTSSYPHGTTIMGVPNAYLGQ